MFCARGGVFRLSVRTQLYDLIKPALPVTHRVITTEVGLDVIDRPVLRLSQRIIERHPIAPNSKHLVTFEARLYAPGIDPVKSEDLLDDLIEKFLYALNNLQPSGIVAWQKAEKVMTEAGNLAYDVTLTISTDKPTS